MKSLLLLALMSTAAVAQVTPPPVVFYNGNTRIGVFGPVKCDGTTVTCAKVSGKLVLSASGGLSSVTADAPLSGAGTSGSHLSCPTCMASAVWSVSSRTITCGGTGACVLDGGDTQLGLTGAGPVKVYRAFGAGIVDVTDNTGNPGALAIRLSGGTGGDGSLSFCDAAGAIDTTVKRTGVGVVGISMFQNTTSGNEGTTVGAAGGASALPGAPLGYLKIKLNSGATVVVPYWTAP